MFKAIFLDEKGYVIDMKFYETLKEAKARLLDKVALRWRSFVILKNNKRISKEIFNKNF